MVDAHLLARPRLLAPLCLRPLPWQQAAGKAPESQQPCQEAANQRSKQPTASTQNINRNTQLSLHTATTTRDCCLVAVCLAGSLGPFMLDVGWLVCKPGFAYLVCRMAGLLLAWLIE